jgi:hypothetical protein
MTNSYAREGFAYGFDFTRLRSREERVARLDGLATLLDTAFILPGTSVRFGFDALIGLVPGIGDAITTAISLYIVHEARQLGAPAHLILRMLANARCRSSATPSTCCGAPTAVTSASCASGLRGRTHIGGADSWRCYSSFFGWICCCCCAAGCGSICRSLKSRCTAS